MTSEITSYFPGRKKLIRYAICGIATYMALDYVWHWGKFYYVSQQRKQTSELTMKAIKIHWTDVIRRPIHDINMAMLSI